MIFCKKKKESKPPIRYASYVVVGDYWIKESNTDSYRNYMRDGLMLIAFSEEEAYELAEKYSKRHQDTFYVFEVIGHVVPHEPAVTITKNIRRV